MRYINRARKPEAGVPPQVEISDNMKKLDSVVRGWITYDQERARTAKQYGWPHSAVDGTDEGKRWLRLYSGFVSALRSRGYTVEPKEQIPPHAICTIQGEPVEFYIRHDTLQRPPTLSGKPLDASQARTGKLLLQASVSFSADAHQWGDRFGRKLEDQLGEAVLAFEALAKEAAVARAKQQAWFAEYRLQQERRQHREKLTAEEARCWEALRRQASEWEEAERLRKYVEAVEIRLISFRSLPHRSTAWLLWARERIAALDPFASGDDVFAERLPRLQRRGRLS